MNFCGNAECFPAKFNRSVCFSFPVLSILHVRVYERPSRFCQHCVSVFRKAYVCVSGCKSTITRFWFAVLARSVQFSFLFLQIDTHDICLPLGAVCKSNLFWRCAAFTGRTIHSFPLALSFFDNRACVYCKPPPPRRPPNLHSRFYECGNLSRDTAEIRLGNSAGIVLDMVLVAPI